MTDTLLDATINATDWSLNNPGILGILVGLVIVILLTMKARHDLQRNAPKLALPVIQPKTCQTCTFWDQAAGQRAMEKHPAFKGAADCITVAEMGYGYKLDENGERVGSNAPKEIELLDWSAVGACHKHAEGRLAIDSCDSYEARRA